MKLVIIVLLVVVIEYTWEESDEVELLREYREFWETRLGLVWNVKILVICENVIGEDEE